jgi:hypothetical protein
MFHIHIGQFDVGISRVTSREGLKVLSAEPAWTPLGVASYTHMFLYWCFHLSLSCIF